MLEAILGVAFYQRAGRAIHPFFAKPELQEYAKAIEKAVVLAEEVSDLFVHKSGHWETSEEITQWFSQPMKQLQ